MNTGINVLCANDKMRELFDDRQSTAAPPGFENVQIKHDHPLMVIEKMLYILAGFQVLYFLSLT